MKTHSIYKEFYNQSDTFFLNKKKCNIFELPRIEKIVLHAHCGSASMIQPDFLPEMYKWFAKIANQKPKLLLSKKDNSNFKIRKHTEIGLKATLRKKRAINFIQKLAIINSCRLTNFQGFNKQYDAQYNWNIGIKNTLIFSEINYATLKYKFGMDITVVTKNINDDKDFILFFEMINIKFLK